MWVGGELDRAKWYRHRFKEGHLVEAPVRDDAGKAQGFILLRVLNHESTASDGHLFAAEFLAASDSHYRWWMLEGEGKKMAKRGLYHSCEGNTADCGFTRGRHPLVHLEKFRIIGARGWSNKVPEWAFKGAARKDIEAFDLRMQSGKEEGEDAVPLPWAEAEEVQSAEEPSSDHPDSDDPGLGEKIQKMRDQLKKLELQQKKAKKAKAAQGAGKTTKDKRKDKAKVKDMEKQRAKSPSSEEPKRRGRSRKPKRRRSKSKERDRKRRRRDATDVKKKKKKESSSDSGSQGPEVGLFEKGSHDDEVQDPIPRKGDRGPFGAGLPVAFDGEDTSDSDEGSVFQAAPPQPVKSGQQALITYSHRRPGRLAARLLIKMKNEVALGSGGASMSSVDKTPPIAVHYLLTLMMPQLGARMNLRTQRELRTIMVTYGHLGPFGKESTSQGSRHPGAKSEGTGEGHHRGPLDDSSVSRALSKRSVKSPRQGRRGLPYEGVPPDNEGGELRPKQRRSRSRPTERRKREGQDRKRRSRRKRKDKEEGHGCNVSPGHEPPTEATAPPDSSTWQESLRSFLKAEKPVLEVFSEVWRVLDQVSSPLGTYVKSCKGHRVPPGPSAKSTRGNELLPLSPAVMDRFTSLPDELRSAMKLVLVVLNFLAMGGRYNPSRDVGPPVTLSEGQEKMLSHIKERVTDLTSEEKRCPPVHEADLVLGAARYDYAGEPIMILEDLEASKVIPVWPQIGEAAVQPVLPYLPEELAEMIEDPKNCLLPSWEWPDQPTKSRVRATQEEWNKIVQAAYDRGLMAPMEDDQVFRDNAGRKVLNGAGGVKKLKKIGGEEKTMQRFISNFIPINQYLSHLSGGDQFLPYLGQLTLLGLEDDETMLVDSEDFCSCFNLFTLPPAWRSMMCFNLTVDAKLMGGTPGHMVYPAMGVVPMGWINAVTVIQSVVRTLVFQGAQVPESSEVAKIKQMPDTDDLTIIYLDSYDELRKLDLQCAEVLEGKPSSRHIRFQQICEEKGLPLNTAKKLVGATRGTLQGGLLDGRKGWYKLAPDKQVDLVSLCLGLVTTPSWREFQVRHVIGKATFGMCFRRPLLSVFQDIFGDLQKLTREDGQAPSPGSLDELFMVLAMVPFMGSSLRVTLDNEITCSDASPTGGGAAVSSEFMAEPQTVEHAGG